MPESQNHPDARIYELAAAQHGVVTRWQLLAAGFTARMIDVRVAQGRLVPVHRGVYRVGPVVSPYAAETAAVLACGDGSAVCGWSAARLWDLPPAPPALARLRGGPPAGDCVFLVSTDRGGARRPGIRLSRVRGLHASEVTSRHGIPVTTPARTLLDIAADLSRAGLLRELEQAVGQAQRERLTSAAEIEAVAGRHLRHGGAALLRRIVKGDAAVTRSRAEERLLELVRNARLPAPQVNVRVAGCIVDFHWPEQRLVVEVDGFAFHSQRDRFESDRARDLELTAAGQTVRRITWRQLTGEAVAVVSQIALALGRAGA